MDKVKNNVVKLTRKAKIPPAPPVENSNEPESLTLCCPFCDGATWGVTVNPTYGEVETMFCLSNECDGDSFVNAIDGILEDHVQTLRTDIRFKPESGDE